MVWQSGLVRNNQGYVIIKVLAMNMMLTSPHRTYEEKAYTRVMIGIIFDTTRNYIF